MILSKIVKAGHTGDGIGDWNLELSAWILENGEESEEFRPFLALGSEPAKNNFKPDQSTDRVDHPNTASSRWKPLRQLSQSAENESQFAALEHQIEPVDGEATLGVDETDSESDLPELEQLSSEASAVEAQEGYDAGYAAGFDAGIAQGLEQAAVDAERLANEQMATLRTQVEQVLDEVETAGAALAEGFDEGLARLSMHLARQLVRGELRTPAPVITQLVESALGEFPVDGALKLFVSPSDKAAFEQLEPRAFSNLQLVADATLSQGSIRLQQGERRTEDLMEQRLSELAQRLLTEVDPSVLTPLAPFTSPEDQSESPLDRGKDAETGGDAGSDADFTEPQE